jgi:mono/diheme cytochrome c family protein
MSLCRRRLHDDEASSAVALKNPFASRGSSRNVANGGSSVRRKWVASGLAFVAVACAVGCDSSPASTPSLAQAFAIQRGSYLLTDLIDCGGCHTSDPTKPFGGGTQFPVDNAGHYVYSRNLTSDSATGMKLTEDQFVTALQTGEDFTNHGQALLVMPWPNLRWMTTDDLKAIYAFLQVLPPASNAVPPDNKGPASAQGPVPLPAQYNEGEETRSFPATTAVDPLAAPGASSAVPDPGHEMLGAAIMPLAYAKMPNFSQRTPEEQASFGRGSYLVNAALCGDCHTNKGGEPRNLTPGPDFLKIPTDSYLTGGATYTVPAALNTVLMQTRSMSQNLIGPSGYFNDPDTTYLSFASEIRALAHTDDNPPLSIGWPMPADHFRNLPEQDLMDIYTYMKILAADYDHTGQVDKDTQDPARYCTSSNDCQPGQTCFIDNSADKTVNNQCLSTKCTTDADCDACQKCTTGTCQAPSSSDACLTLGL